MDQANLDKDNILNTDDYSNSISPQLVFTITVQILEEVWLVPTSETHFQWNRLLVDQIRWDVRK